MVSGRGVQSVEVGGRLLEALVRIGQPAMLRDLAQAAQLTPAQAHAYLLSFRKLRLVEQDEASGRYSLGPFALEVGLARMRSADPLRMASKAAAEFAAEMGLMVTLAVWGTHGPTIIQVQEASQAIHVNLRAGSVYTITGTATGQLFAAFLPRAQVQPLLAEELRGVGGTNRKIGRATSEARLEHDIAAIRTLGYATTEGVPVPGINAVSAPVFDHMEQMQLAVTAIGNAGVLDCGPDSRQTAAVVALARRLSAELGYRSERPAEPVSAPRRGRPRAPADAAAAPRRSRTR
ncbi:IclR family transcriptional regulator [Roseomonas marmotae]|uniref:IclR family transcriptional regulator n=1 Tax=Roseomonas marmotae TaxID=2768161 RepID=A0ABS3KAW4_9PROT|nr:IclR family transcriptional regulator [Roseomonas marmotae]MBO1074611.1 IclR family transcriptional regulator [Roseomonas marmotae]QTI81635.1 IclR family transcriptional regulator [Roseomonas marmotae]